MRLARPTFAFRSQGCRRGGFSLPGLLLALGAAREVGVPKDLDFNQAGEKQAEPEKGEGAEKDYPRLGGRRRRVHPTLESSPRK